MHYSAISEGPAYILPQCGIGDQRRLEDPKCEIPLGGSKLLYPSQKDLYDDY